MAVFTVSKKLPSMDSYTVADANGAALYSAKHHLGLTKEHWDIADADGSTVATLTHERQHMHATFVITGQGLADAKLTKTNYLPLSETWTLDGGAGQAILKGDLADYQWSLTMPDGILTATFVRKMVSLHRQYTVTVEGDPRVALAMAIALDVDQEEHK